MHCQIFLGVITCMKTLNNWHSCFSKLKAYLIATLYYRIAGNFREVKFRGCGMLFYCVNVSRVWIWQKRVRA